MLSGGLTLDEYMIRTDSSGRSFCYVRGKDGLLEKRYLEVGANNWGVITIKSGLAQNDYIAFPYGKGVEEGAKTVEVDYLTAVDGEVTIKSGLKVRRGGKQYVREYQACISGNLVA